MLVYSVGHGTPLLFGIHCILDSGWPTYVSWDIFHLPILNKFYHHMLIFKASSNTLMGEVNICLTNDILVYRDRSSLSGICPAPYYYCHNVRHVA